MCIIRWLDDTPVSGGAGMVVNDARSVEAGVCLDELLGIHQAVRLPRPSGAPVLIFPGQYLGGTQRIATELSHADHLLPFRRLRPV